MKIAIFGASGGMGLSVVEQALSAGHLVTALARTPSKIDIQHQNLSLFQGDALDKDAVKKAIAGQQAVISVLGPARPVVPGMMETAAKNIVAGMQTYGIRRLISTTGAGVRDPQDQPKLVDHVMKTLLTLLAGDVLRDSVANVEVIQASDLDWTIVRFPRLMDGAYTGKYRVGYLGKEAGSQISRADGADFVLKELVEGKWVRKSPVVSY